MTRLTLLIVPIILASCASDQQRSTELLNRRLQVTMGQEIADSRVVLQPLPDGAQVTMLDPAALPDDAGAMDNRLRDPRASLIQGLLDPSLMRIEVADTSGQPDYVRQKQVQAFVHYMGEYRLGPTVQTPEVPAAVPLALTPAAEAATTPAAAAATTPAAAAMTPASPPGLTVSIHVQCPDRTSWPGYGQGQSAPSCH